MPVGYITEVRIWYVSDFSLVREVRCQWLDRLDGMLGDVRGREESAEADVP